MSMPLTIGQRTPTACISRGNVVLFYTADSYLYKRLFPYGTDAWEDAVQIRLGSHPSVTDQSGLLWLTWQEDVGAVSTIYYATSADGGRNFSAPVTLTTAADLPGVCTQEDGYVGVAYREIVTNTVLYKTERDNFVGTVTIAAPTETVSHVTMCNHLDRIFVGWIENESAKYKFSVDYGTIWSSEITLGTCTWLSLLSLPTDHLLAVTEYHHILQGQVSRDNGNTWDPPHTLWLPEAALNPHVMRDSYNDVIVFSSELSLEFNNHTYIVKLRSAPFFAVRGETLDTSGTLNI